MPPRAPLTPSPDGSDADQGHPPNAFALRPPHTFDSSTVDLNPLVSTVVTPMAAFQWETAEGVPALLKTHQSGGLVRYDTVGSAAKPAAVGVGFWPLTNGSSASTAVVVLDSLGEAEPDPDWTERVRSDLVALSETVNDSYANFDATGPSGLYRLVDSIFTDTAHDHAGKVASILQTLGEADRETFRLVLGHLETRRDLVDQKNRWEAARWRSELVGAGERQHWKLPDTDEGFSILPPEDVKQYFAPSAAVHEDRLLQCPRYSGQSCGGVGVWYSAVTGVRSVYMLCM